jgi:hypothetical protein
LKGKARHAQARTEPRYRQHCQIQLLWRPSAFTDRYNTSSHQEDRFILLTAGAERTAQNLRSVTPTESERSTGFVLLVHAKFCQGALNIYEMASVNSGSNPCLGATHFKRELSPNQPFLAEKRDAAIQIRRHLCHVLLGHHVFILGPGLDGSVQHNHLDIAILALYGDGYSIHGTEEDEVHGSITDFKAANFEPF